MWAEAAKKFEGTHPGVKVEINYLENGAHSQTITTLLQSSDKPSIFHAGVAA
jgi:raffinose/stachyose/melibiose transport system substrate-binding protein